MKSLLKGKVAVVTGGTRGIGYAIVKKYLEAGAITILCGSREETAKKALEKIKAEMPVIMLADKEKDVDQWNAVNAPKSEGEQ